PGDAVRVLEGMAPGQDAEVPPLLRLEPSEDGTGYRAPDSRSARSSSAARDYWVSRRRIRPGACRRQQAPVGGRPMTDDQLILLAVLPIFRPPTDGDRAPSPPTDRPRRRRR